MARLRRNRRAAKIKHARTHAAVLAGSQTTRRVRVRLRCTHHSIGNVVKNMNSHTILTDCSLPSNNRFGIQTVANLRNNNYRYERNYIHSQVQFRIYMYDPLNKIRNCVAVEYE